MPKIDNLHCVTNFLIIINQFQTGFGDTYFPRITSDNVAVGVQIRLSFLEK